MRKVDIAVIGAGAGGLTVAYTVKGFNKSVLLIDKGLPGGECTWSGCIPSKALINQANEIYTARKYADFEVDSGTVLKTVREVIRNVYQTESIEVLERDGIEFLKGEATFIGKRTLLVNEERIEANKIFIATGSSPNIPPIPGLMNVNFLTNENIFELEELPKKMIVLGAGAIGVEISQALNRLGVEIELVERAKFILPREDPELTTLLHQRLKDEGIQIYIDSNAVLVEDRGNEVCLTIDTPTGRKVLTAERIFCALGRKPNLNTLDLRKANISYNNNGIEVNKYLETTSKGIYAVGDVVGPYLLSHMANVQGIRAVKNAILPFKRKIDYSHVSWCTFTSPELATAGLTEKEARLKYGNSIRVYKHSYQHLDRAKTNVNSIGLVKLICDKYGSVIGCSILGDRAGELISEIQVVKTLGIRFKKISKVIHPYPTYSEVLVKIAKKVAVDDIKKLIS